MLARPEGFVGPVAEPDDRLKAVGDVFCDPRAKGVSERADTWLMAVDAAGEKDIIHPCGSDIPQDRLFLLRRDVDVVEKYQHPGRRWFSGQVIIDRVVGQREEGFIRRDVRGQILGGGFDRGDPLKVIADEYFGPGMRQIMVGGVELFCFRINGLHLPCGDGKDQEEDHDPYRAGEIA